MFADLTGKTALVTGGTRGIGFAIAKELKAAGAEVIITGSSEESAKKGADALGVKGLALNLSNKETFADFFAKVAELGSIDILVNNAGITKDGPFLRQKQDAWDEVLDVNLNANVALCKHFVPLMMKKRWGRVVNISSVVAFMGNVGQTNYIASKAGIVGFSKALSTEVARRGVTVNCIAPGFIETDMTKAMPEAAVAQMQEKIPSGTFGTPEDIANSVRFLSSDAASYITGTTIHVNGGLYF